MQAFQGYVESGKIIPLGNPVIPDGSKAIITILEGLDVNTATAERQLKALEQFRQRMKETGPLPPEFDEAISRRVNIARQIDL
jgi:hypothetical protein